MNSESRQYERPNLTVEAFDNVRYNLERNSRFIVVREGEERITVSAHELTTLHAEAWIEDDVLMIGFTPECFELGKSIGRYRVVESDGNWSLREPCENKSYLMVSPACHRYVGVETPNNLYHRSTSLYVTMWIYEVFAFCLVATEALDATA